MTGSVVKFLMNLQAAPLMRDALTHYSGILVIARPEDLDASARAVDSLENVEVHLRDRPRGRMIAVLESDDAAGQEILLRRIREVPGVLSAALVYHYVDNPAAGDAAAGERQ